MKATIYIKNPDGISDFEVKNFKSVSLTSGYSSLQTTIDESSLSKFSISRNYTYNFFGDTTLSVPGELIRNVEFD